MTNSLEERVEYLEQKVAALEKRLEHVEARKEGKQPFPIKQQPKPVHDDWNPKELISEKESIHWESFIFQKLLPRFFIFIFIIGVLWGLKAAFDYGVITIQVILTLGIITAIAMAILGVWQMKKNRLVLGQVLIGGAIPVFMMTVFAMHQLYYMIGPTAAFLLNVAAVLAGMIFTYEYRSQSIGVVSAVAGVLIPFLIKSMNPNFYLFLSYETVLYVLFLCLALYLNFKVLYQVSTLFLHVAILLFYQFSRFIPESLHLAIVIPILIQQIALFIGGLFTKNFIQKQAFTTLAYTLITASWVWALLSESEATSIFGFFIVLYAAGFYFYRKDYLRAPIFLVNGCMNLLFIFILHESRFTFELLLITAMIYVYYAYTFKTRFHYVLAAVQFLIAFIMVNTFNTILWSTIEMFHWIFFILISTTCMYLLLKAKLTQKQLLLNLTVPFYGFLLINFTSILTTVIINEFHLYESKPIILSSLWVVIALLFMIASKFIQITQGKYVGVIILFLTLARLILYDFSFIALPIKAILFIGLGVVGLLVSRFYYKR